MKKLFAVALAASMLFSTAGCMVATNQTLVIPVSEDTDAPVLMTYYGESVSPFTFPDMPDSKEINVVKLDPAGVSVWAKGLTEEEIALFEGPLNMSLDAGILAPAQQPAPAVVAEAAAVATPDAKDAKAVAAPEATPAPILTETQILQDAQAQMDAQAVMLAGLTEEEQAKMVDMMTAISDTLFTDDQQEQEAIMETVLLSFGPSFASYNLTNAQKRINSHYPGKTIVGAYSLLMTDINGIYPATGKPESIHMEMPLGEGNNANAVAIIATNGAIVSRQAKIIGSNLCFTVPSTLGTLILILE